MIYHPHFPLKCPSLDLGQFKMETVTEHRQTSRKNSVALDPGAEDRYLKFSWREEVTPDMSAVLRSTHLNRITKVLPFVAGEPKREALRN